MHEAQVGRSNLLALLYVLSGAFCLIGAARPIARNSPVTLLWLLGGIGLVVGGVIWVVGARLRPWAVHAAFVLMAGLIALLASQSATAVGIAALGPVIIALGLYAAHFFAQSAARLHVGGLIAVTSTGAALAEPAGILHAWFINMVSVGVLTEVQGRLARQLRTAATTDPLTGLANRRAWEAAASRSLAHAARTGEPLTIAVLDLDGFKAVNDREGHGAGDALLQALTVRWTHQLRHADLLGRYGGDEFVLCLPGTDAAAAAEILDRLRASHEFSWSVGTATLRNGDTVSAMLARADADLYRQKRRGRPT